MKHERVNYLIAGVFVLLSIAVLMWMLFEITGDSGPTDDYHVYYKNVNGLRYGTAVSYEGYLIGQVEGITPERDGAGTRYRVDFTVEKDWAIPDDSVAEISASGLLAQIFIGIREGQSDSSLSPGSEITGAANGGMMKAINEVAGEMQELTRSTIRPMLETLHHAINTVTQNLDAGLGGLADSVNENNRQNLSDLLANLNDASGDLKQTMAEVRSLSSDTRNLLTEDNRAEFAQILQHSAEAARNFAILSGNLEQSRSRLDATLNNLDQAVDNADGTVLDNREDIRNMVSELRSSVHAVSGSVEDIARQLEGASRNMNDFSRQIRRNPSVLLRGEFPQGK